MMGEATGRQNSDSKGGRKENKQTTTTNKKKRMVILLHTQAITETKSCLGEGRGGEGGREGGGGEIRGRQKKKKRGGKPEEAQETKPLASVFTMHVKQTTNDLKHFFWWWRYEVSLQKKRKKYICMINLQRGEGWGGGSLGDQFVKCVYFFQLYFLFFTITIYFL